MPKPNFVRKPMDKLLEQKLKDLPSLPDHLIWFDEAEEKTPVEDTYDRFIRKGQEKA